ncbi:c-type cytochrome [Inquilinus limosus]|uniref:Cytochrome c family protein n=1 Tax=Inquilinus limosus TaxID=171674 RepID=A0A211YXS0_9PROT|nr:cytochrome c family protein [Inquilinus limosus]OWJ57832.1 cytochrome c family protein [Inquilinus limosus]
MRASLWALAALLTAGATAPALADGDAARGQTLFSRCSACHTVTDQNKLGPHLSGVVGRVAGTLPGYTFSRAMVAYAKPWDEPTLDAFLAGPAKAVPGTKMAAPPISNPQDRADLIAYLKTVPAS